MKAIIQKRLFATNTVTMQKAKLLQYSLQTKDYTLIDIEDIQQYLAKQNQFSYGRLYFLNNYPNSAKDDTLLQFKPLANVEGEEQAQKNTYGTDIFNALTSLRSTVECDAMIGVRFTQESNLTNVTPIVKETREFMKSSETRDSLSVLFVNNVESLKTIAGNPSLKLENFAEALVDYKNP